MKDIIDAQKMSVDWGWLQIDASYVGPLNPFIINPYFFTSPFSQLLKLYNCDAIAW